MATVPWNGSPLTIAVTDKGAALTVRSFKEGDNPAHVFDPATQLEDLFATLAGAKMPVLANNFVMYGEEKGENGRPMAVKAKVQRPYTDKNGEARMANHAYDGKQLDAFIPVGFAVKTKFMKVGNRNIPQPLFMAYATAMERTPSQNAASFQRVTAHKVVEAPAPVITRKKAATA